MKRRDFLAATAAVARVELSKHPNTAAPTNPANVKKALANSEPSTHGAKRTFAKN